MGKATRVETEMVTSQEKMAHAEGTGSSNSGEQWIGSGGNGEDVRFSLGRKPGFEVNGEL